MANIAKMEMANDLFKKDCIKVEKAFLGLMTKVVYTPTNSPLVGICLEYDVANGQKVKQLIESAPSKLEAIIQKEGCPKPSDNGNVRLSICFSKDHHFAALQLSQFSNFEYHPMSEIHFVEGEDAEKELRPFIK